MSHTFQGAWWEVDLPADWSGEQDESCSAFFAQDGVGALQISAYQTDENVTDLDLQEFAAEHISAGAKLLPVQFGSFVGFCIHFRGEDEYWRQWWLRCRETMIFATYNCALEDRGTEDEQVEQILSTLRTR